MDVLPIIDDNGKTLTAQQLHLIAINNSEIIEHEKDIELRIKVGEKIVSFFVDNNKLTGISEDENIRSLELKRLLLDSYVLMYHRMLNTFSSRSE
jgi:hypothetical protein